jgi:MarR family transcriptional regulator, transcriptional regulator for hemolysin
MDNRYDRQASGGYVTNRAARLFVRALERRLLNGTAGQMPVFLALIDGSAYTQTELARIASVEQPTMANTLARMERDGLIARTPDPKDRRSSLVSLNALGAERAAEAMEAALAVNEAAFADLDAAERQQFFSLLHRVIGALEADTRA